MEFGPFTGINFDSFDDLQSKVLKMQTEIEKRSEMTNQEKKALLMIDTQLKMFHNQIDQHEKDKIQEIVSLLLKKYRTMYDY